MVAAYKQILAFRAAHEAVKMGTLTAYADNDITSFEKIYGSDDVLTMVNTRNSAIIYNVPTVLQNTTWKNGLTGAVITFGTQYTFQPYTYLILTK